MFSMSVVTGGPLGSPTSALVQDRIEKLKLGETVTTDLLELARCV